MFHAIKQYSKKNNSVNFWMQNDKNDSPVIKIAYCQFSNIKNREKNQNYIIVELDKRKDGFAAIIKKLQDAYPEKMYVQHIYDYKNCEYLFSYNELRQLLLHQYLYIDSNDIKDVIKNIGIDCFSCSFLTKVGFSLQEIVDEMYEFGSGHQANPRH